MKKVIFGLALFAISAAANAVTVYLVAHNQTSGSGAISSLITDGSHTTGIAPASTAAWNWDGTTISSTGLYSNVSSIGSSPFSSTVLSDQIVNLSISGGVATAASYTCVEGTFLAVVGANGCGGYTLGANTVDDSTTVWSGTSVSQTIGGDDVATGSPRTITAYNFSSAVFDGTTLLVGTGIAVGSDGGEAMTFSTINPAVPVPAAVWLFGSALGLLGWVRRRVAQ